MRYAPGELRFLRLIASAALGAAMFVAFGCAPASSDGTGAAGTNGAAGTSGAAGSAGNGTAGTSGSAGAAGTGGPTGVAGTTGAAGTGGSGATAGVAGTAATGGSIGGAGAGGSTGGRGGTAGGAAGTGGRGGTTGAAGAGGRGGTTGAAGAGGRGGTTGSGGSGGAMPRFSFFVTSIGALRTLSGSQNGFGGDLRYGETGDGAGLRGADKICTAIAEMSMPGSGAKGWHAFLSAPAMGTAPAVNAIDRIGAGPWYDRMGRLFSASKANLNGFRPSDADAAIKNDFPNENGILNHSDGAPGAPATTARTTTTR